MEGAGSSRPGRVKVIDLIAADGLASDKYNDAVTTLSQSLAKYNFAILELASGDDVLVKCVLDSARMFFHQRPIPSSAGFEQQQQQQQQQQIREWNLSTGYYFEPYNACEVYDFRPGLHGASHQGEHSYSPVALPELFTLLGKVSRLVLCAICRSLNLRSFCFADLLDNVPLKPGEFSTSVLSVRCHARPGVGHGGHFTGAVSGHLSSNADNDTHTAKGLLSLMKSDKPGLQVRDEQGRWLLVDMDLGPCDMVMFTGLALYQCTAGYISPGLHRYCMEAASTSQHGRCSVSYRLMPRPPAVLHCSAMVAAGHGVTGPFQQPIPVCDFMQRAFSTDRPITINKPSFSSHGCQSSDGSMKAVIKYQRQVLKVKPLAPSKRLRLEAQRVLKEKVQEIADRKGVKIRFCSLKDCEEQHIPRLESPCASIRADLGWPAGVPFVHPHDLPNKAKQAFLKAYEPGWTTSPPAAGEMGTDPQTHVCEFLPC